MHVGVRGSPKHSLNNVILNLSHLRWAQLVFAPTATAPERSESQTLAWLLIHLCLFAKLGLKQLSHINLSQPMKHMSTIVLATACHKAKAEDVQTTFPSRFLVLIVKQALSLRCCVFWNHMCIQRGGEAILWRSSRPNTMATSLDQLECSSQGVSE